MSEIDAILGISPVLLLGVLVLVPLGLYLGIKVRQCTNFDRPTDFLTALITVAVLSVIVVDGIYGLGIPLTLPVLFFVFYFVGFRVGMAVTDRNRRQFLKIGKDDEGNIRMTRPKGLYYEHPKYGLVGIPETNGELFNQIFRGIYHKVKSNAPLDENICFVDETAKPEKRKKTKTPQANIVDDDTGFNAILVEEIITTYDRDDKRFLHPRVPKTTIRIAHGSQIPKAQLLKDMATVDELNKNIVKAEAKAVEIETAIIPKLPQISAVQLMAIAENSTVMELVNAYLASEEKRKGAN